MTSRVLLQQDFKSTWPNQSIARSLVARSLDWQRPLKTTCWAVSPITPSAVTSRGFCYRAPDFFFSFVKTMVDALQPTFFRAQILYSLRSLNKPLDLPVVICRTPERILGILCLKLTGHQRPSSRINYPSAPPASKAWTKLLKASTLEKNWNQMRRMNNVLRQEEITEELEVIMLSAVD